MFTYKVATRTIVVEATLLHYLADAMTRDMTRCGWHLNHYMNTHISIQDVTLQDKELKIYYDKAYGIFIPKCLSYLSEIASVTKEKWPYLHTFYL